MIAPRAEPCQRLLQWLVQPKEPGKPASVVIQCLDGAGQPQEDLDLFMQARGLRPEQGGQRLYRDAGSRRSAGWARHADAWEKRADIFPLCATRL
jgi:hypothetical protein